MGDRGGEHGGGSGRGRRVGGFRGLVAAGRDAGAGVDQRAGLGREAGQLNRRWPAYRWSALRVSSLTRRATASAPIMVETITEARLRAAAGVRSVRWRANSSISATTPAEVASRTSSLPRASSLASETKAQSSQALPRWTLDR